MSDTWVDYEVHAYVYTYTYTSTYTYTHTHTYKLPIQVLYAVALHSMSLNFQDFFFSLSGMWTKAYELDPERVDAYFYIGQVAWQHSQA